MHIGGNVYFVRAAFSLCFAYSFSYLLTGAVVDKQTCTLVSGASNGCKEVVPDGGFDFFAPVATPLPVVQSRSDWLRDVVLAILVDVLAAVVWLTPLVPRVSAPLPRTNSNLTNQTHK